MRIQRGRVLEIIIGQTGAPATKIICAPGSVPGPGQYLVAWDPAQKDAALGVPLFLSSVSDGGFVCAPPVPPSWLPGTSLLLRGPLGRGFRLPADCRRLALAALGETAERLMPLALGVLGAGGDVTLFSDVPVTTIPSAVEFYPLSALAEGLPWADFLAVDLPLQALPALGSRLGVEGGFRLPCPGQALVWTGMPCAGQAACGACAVPVRKGWKLACEDGPVFDLSDLLV